MPQKQSIDPDRFAAALEVYNGEAPSKGQSIPEARGFSAALETLYATGGNLRNNPNSRRGGMRFTEGKLRGLTPEQATAMGRRMWQNASPAIKEKYAGMEESMLAPSERAAARQRIPGIEMPSRGGAAAPEKATIGAGSGTPVRGSLPTLPQVHSTGAPGPYRFPTVPDASSQNPATGTTDVEGRAWREEQKVKRPKLIEAARSRGDMGAVARLEEQAKLHESFDALHSGGMEESAAFAEAKEVRAGAAEQVIPGLTKPAAMNSAPSLQPNGGAPSRSSLIPGLMKPEQSAPRRINRLTGKPFGYVPPTAAAPAPTGYAGPKSRFDPDLGQVPTAVEVSERPMDFGGYEKLGKDIKTTLEPNSPEMSAALGRRRTFEDQQAKANAAKALRERTGPSYAERDAQQRQATRRLDQRVASSYGETGRTFPVTPVARR